jgi:4-hydroxy-tetrahydrodipicolinate reductase
MRIAIAGSSGRMGRMLIETVLKAEDMQLAAALDVAGSAYLGKDAGELVGAPCGTPIRADFDAALAGVDCLIDFTRPAGTLAHLASCRKHGVAMVIGTTGMEAEQKKAIEHAGRDIPIVFAPNMAVGVNLVFKLLDTAARVLAQGYDIEGMPAQCRQERSARWCSTPP